MANEDGPVALTVSRPALTTSTDKHTTKNAVTGRINSTSATVGADTKGAILNTNTPVSARIWRATAREAVVGLGASDGINEIGSRLMGKEIGLVTTPGDSDSTAEGVAQKLAVGEANTLDTDALPAASGLQPRQHNRTGLGQTNIQVNRRESLNQIQSHMPVSARNGTASSIVDAAASVTSSFGTKLSSLLKYGSSALLSTLVSGEPMGGSTGNADLGSGCDSVVACTPNKATTGSTGAVIVSAGEGKAVLAEASDMTAVVDVSESKCVGDDGALEELVAYERDAEMEGMLGVDTLDFELGVTGTEGELSEIHMDIDAATDAITERGSNSRGKGRGQEHLICERVLRRSAKTSASTNATLTIDNGRDTTVLETGIDGETARSAVPRHLNNNTNVMLDLNPSDTTTTTTGGVHATTDLALTADDVIIEAPTPANRPQRACVNRPKAVHNTAVSLVVEKQSPKHKRVKLDHEALAAMKAATHSRPRGSQGLPASINQATGEPYPRRPPRRVSGLSVHAGETPIRQKPAAVDVIPKPNRRDKPVRVVRVDPNPQIQERTRKKLAGVVVKVSPVAPAQIPEGDNPDVLVCPRPDCSKRFLIRVDYDIHAKLHTDERPEVCDWEGCPKCFKTHHSYLTHHRIHTCTKHFACTWTGCGKYFDRNTKLLAHMRTHTGERPYRCAYKGCGQCFAQASHMATHCRTHTGERPYACTWEGCDKSFARSSSRDHHLRTHTGERPFDCTWEGCDKAFARMNSLVDHMRTHTGERPYKCQWEGCGKAFAQSSSLGTHWKVHTGEKPFVCVWRDCDKRFSDRSGLEHHKRTHTGERPYPCNIQGCGKRFAQSTNLTRHLKTHADSRVK